MPLFERGDPPAGWETKASDISGASSKVILTSVTGDMDYPAEANPTAFAMSAELRASVSDLPMSPDGATLKQRIAVLEDASNVQRHCNNVTKSTLDALGNDQRETRNLLDEKLAAVEAELSSKLEDMSKDLDMRFADQVDENDRTNRKMSNLKQENNQLRRKFAVMLMRLQTIEKEMEIVVPDDLAMDPIKTISGVKK